MGILYLSVVLLLKVGLYAAFQQKIRTAKKILAKSGVSILLQKLKCFPYNLLYFTLQLNDNARLTFELSKTSCFKTN